MAEAPAPVEVPPALPTPEAPAAGGVVSPETAAAGGMADQLQGALKTAEAGGDISGALEQASQEPPEIKDTGETTPVIIGADGAVKAAQTEAAAKAGEDAPADAAAEGDEATDKDEKKDEKDDPEKKSKEKEMRADANKEVALRQEKARLQIEITIINAQMTTIIQAKENVPAEVINELAAKRGRIDEIDQELGVLEKNKNKMSGKEKAIMAALVLAAIMTASATQGARG